MLKSLLITGIVLTLTIIYVFVFALCKVSGDLSREEEKEEDKIKHNY